MGRAGGRGAGQAQPAALAQPGAGGLNRSKPRARCALHGEREHFCYALWELAGFEWALYSTAWSLRVTSSRLAGAGKDARALQKANQAHLK